ncbi:tubulin-specific chaperone E [Magnaporthiopsis poae ATCC 64411]|uniref:Tubulin-specific chaperone E n=1 Tax=Magnaporthiopsis poae (strain ATCC 64411 / 73-15) TaxID=644358 RepID=A0A0C4DLC8_MAGP6|nr:tubulin-specific chaperone E [Magnaporthiopsis poae ATCC 64411]
MSDWFGKLSKYVTDEGPIQYSEIVISGKVAEEVGFDKVRRQQARLDELRVAILDGACIDRADGGHASIGDLDLSRNLLPTLSAVAAICAQLPDLRILRLDGNRFRPPAAHDAAIPASAFAHVADLSLDESLLSWADVCSIASHFPALTSLSCGLNLLSTLPTPPPASLAASLTSLNLEYNDFTALSDLAALSALSSLRNLHLKGNNICDVVRDAANPPRFPASLQYVDLSYNRIASWGLVDALPACFPGLASLRLAHNPVYESAAPAAAAVPPAQLAGGGRSGVSAGAVDEDPYMITIARVACLQHLNFSTITPAERTNAEVFYLSRIARQLSSVPEGSESTVLALHPRYRELCDAYGEPAVVRHQEVSQSFLDGRLVKVHFHLADGSSIMDNDCQPNGGSAGGEEAATGVTATTTALAPDGTVKTAEIPRSLDMYAVKGIAGRLFGLSPMGLSLVWETGEWDPVAGFDDESGEGSGAEDEVASSGAAADGGRGRLVRRQVRLIDSPRQFGYCIDGSEARIRVEQQTV